MEDPVIVDLIFEHGINTLDEYDEITCKLKCVSKFLNEILSFEDKRLQVRLILEKVIDSLIITVNLAWRFFPKYDQLFIALNKYCLRWEKQVLECFGERRLLSFLNEVYFDCWVINNFERFQQWNGWVQGKFLTISRFWGIKLSMYYKGSLVKQLFPQLFPENLILDVFHNNIQYINDLHKRLKKLIKYDSNRKFIYIGYRRLLSMLNSNHHLRNGLFFVPPCYELLFQMLNQKYFPRFLDPLSLVIYDSFGNSLSIIENENQSILQHYLTKDQKCIDLLMEIDKFDSLDIEVFRNVQESNLSLYLSKTKTIKNKN